MTTPDEHSTETSIRPTSIDVPEEDLLDLRHRIAAALREFLAPYREGGGGSR